MRFLRILPVILLFSLFLSACGGAAQPSSADHSGLKMAPMADMPENVQRAPQTVRESYQFAVANPGVMKVVPCYCGCGSMGHTSNYSCYVKDVVAGKVEFDDHALGCSICVDITQDVMRMTKDGKSPGDIKAYVDATYSKYGPSNIP